MNPLRLLVVLVPTLAAGCAAASADAVEDPAAENESEVGKPIRPRPSCGACSWGDIERRAFWNGHDSQPQIAKDVGSGKVARDITYCLLKSAVGGNGQREITAKRIGSGWYEQGVSTRLALSSANAPSGNNQGAITGWHAVTLTVFGQKLNPDTQWFEMSFPVELTTKKPTGTWGYDASGRLAPQYYTPTGYYTDAIADFFVGPKVIQENGPGTPSVTLFLAQAVVFGGNNMQIPFPTFGDDRYPSYEVGETSMFFGQTLASSTPSTNLTAKVPIVSAKVFTFDLIAEAQVRHYLKVKQGVDPDAASKGELSLEMGSKTTFKLRAKGKLHFGFFDVDLDQTIFQWSPLNETRKLGSATFDGRRIVSHVDVDNRNDSNPGGWLSSCLTSTPSVSSEVPKSDVDQWVNDVRSSVVGNVVGCKETSSEVFGKGKLCDKLGRPIPTYP